MCMSCAKVAINVFFDNTCTCVSSMLSPYMQYHAMLSNHDQCLQY